jgi:hypothetical protein
MLSGLLRQVHKVKFLLNENSTTILTGVGVSGTVVTAYLTGRASFKAAGIIEHEKNLLDAKEGMPGYSNGDRIHVLTKPGKVKLVWRLYLPPVGVGVITVTSIVMANKISSRQIAALTVASGISERAFTEYKAKVVEKLGERHDRAVRDEIAQDRVNQNPVGSREIILAGTGEVLCYDMTTGRYFQSTIEEIKRAENKVNHDVINHYSVSLSEFYDEIGLPPTSYSDSVGWNMSNHLEVTFSTTMSSDQRPCIAIDFVKQPISGYDKIYD